MIIPKLLGLGQTDSVTSSMTAAIVSCEKINLFMIKDFSPYMKDRSHRYYVDLFLVTKDWEYKLVDIVTGAAMTASQRSDWNYRIEQINRALQREPAYSKWPPIGDWEYSPMDAITFKRWLDTPKGKSLLSVQPPLEMCHICGKFAQQMGNHVRKTHGEDEFHTYFRDHLSGFDRPACKNPMCGKPTELVSYTLGYRDYCSRACLIAYTNRIKAVDLTASPESQ